MLFDLLSVLTIHSSHILLDKLYNWKKRMCEERRICLLCAREFCPEEEDQEFCSEECEEEYEQRELEDWLLLLDEI